jgi:hypothetical protein
MVVCLPPVPLRRPTSRNPPSRGRRARRGAAGARFRPISRSWPLLSCEFKGGLGAQVGLGAGTTVLDPNPPRVYDAMGGAEVNPGKGVVGASGACAAPTTARPGRDCREPATGGCPLKGGAIVVRRFFGRLIAQAAVMMGAPFTDVTRNIYREPQQTSKTNRHPLFELGEFR